MTIPARCVCDYGIDPLHDHVLLGDGRRLDLFDLLPGLLLWPALLRCGCDGRRVVRYPPAFPTQQHEDPPETVADPSGGNLLDPSKQWRNTVLPGLVVPRRAAPPDNLAGTAHADAVTNDQMAHGLLARVGLRASLTARPAP